MNRFHLILMKEFHSPHLMNITNSRDSHRCTNLFLFSILVKLCNHSIPLLYREQYNGVVFGKGLQSLSVS